MKEKDAMKTAVWRGVLYSRHRHHSELAIVACRVTSRRYRRTVPMVGQGKMPSTEAVKLAVGGTLNVERLSTDPIT
jgi:hypothetical protein